VFLVLPAASPIWASGLIPFGRYIQFPWRLLGHASLVFSLAAGIAAARLPLRRRGDWTGWLTAAAAVATIWGGAHLIMTPDIAMNPGPAGIRSLNTETTYLNEYLPRGAAAPGLRAGLVTDAQSAVVHSASGFGTIQRLKFTAVVPVSIVLALHDYPGWAIAQQEGPARVSLGSTESRLLTLTVMQPGDYDVQLDFLRTPWRWMGLLASMLSLLALWPLLRILARRNGSVASLPKYGAGHACQQDGR
jgi:hypothetical protein